MPEMPEVETIARQLRKNIMDKRIMEVRLSGLPLRKPISKAFAEKLCGCRIRKIHRRGKYLIVELEPKAFWLIHLGMSGRIFYPGSGDAGTKHTHAVFRFSDTTGLEYRDHRRFGMLAVYEDLPLERIPEIRSLGKDPLCPGFNQEWLYLILQKKKQEIKAFLLDQRMVAGLGNIYVCESLFWAQIHPMRRCATLTEEESLLLVQAIRKVLRSAIRNRGTSFSDFIGADGNRGQNQSFLTVFQRAGAPCLHCQTPIQRMRQGNRSSFYCPNCQR